METVAAAPSSENLPLIAQSLHTLAVIIVIRELLWSEVSSDQLALPAHYPSSEKIQLTAKFYGQIHFLWRKRENPLTFTFKKEAGVDEYN